MQIQGVRASKQSWASGYFENGVNIKEKRLCPQTDSLVGDVSLGTCVPHLHV